MSYDGFDDDPRDETLARGLRGLAPSEFELDADHTLGSMRPALRRARVRRRLAVSTSVLGVFAVMAAGAVVVQDSSTSHVNIRSHTPSSVSTPSKTPTSTAPKASTTTTTTTTPSPTTSTVPANRTSTTRGGIGVVGPLPTASTPRPTTPTTHGNHGGATSTTVPAPSNKTYTSIGGNVTIRVANGRLTLVSYKPSAGYTAEVHTNTPTDIELRFSNSQGESRIRVRVQDGELRPEITEN